MVYYDDSELAPELRTLSNVVVLVTKVPSMLECADSPPSRMNCKLL